MKKNSLLIMFLCTATFYSCHKSNSTPSNNTQVDVYVAGWVANPADYSVATYWKNGVPVSLTNDTTEAIANSIFVSGNDVYVAGLQYNLNYLQVAEYWKNGTKVILGDAVASTITTNSTATSIFVSGSDVYVAGYSFDFNSQTSQAIYWKNGVPVYLPSAGTSGIATCIMVSGNDVYVTGADDYGNGVYWKNGNRIILQPNTNASFIAISGNNVYATGVVFPPTQGQGIRRAALWKNDVLSTYLNDGTNETFGEAIAISGNDIYVAGSSFDQTSNHPLFWKNGALNYLPSKGGSGAKGVGITNSIAAFENDIYIAGDDESGSFYSHNTAAYWKNGALVALTDTLYDSEALSIFIAKK
jgi:hypothetical protein